MTDAELTDEEINSALGAGVIRPEQLLIAVHEMGIKPTGRSADDVRAVADKLEVDVETLLYALASEESPLFQQDDW